MHRELHKKMNVLKLFTEKRMFEYEKPQMTYDRETGEVEIFDPMEEKRKPKKKIIKDVDEIYAEKERVLKELNMDSPTEPAGENLQHEELVKKAEKIRT